MLTNKFDFKSIEHQITYKKEGCIINNKKTSTIEYINLYVQITNKCNAACKFCSNLGNTCEKFNKDIFKMCFDEIYNNKFINKVTFTGGEPTLEKDLVECIMYVYNTDPDIHIYLDTNATNLEVLEKISPYVKNIALSRHHYDDLKNNKIFGIKTATTDDLNNLSENTKLKINLRCNLIKNNIDSIEECQKYLDWCNKIQLNNVGFIKLMPYTQYAKDNFVDVNLKEINNMNLIKHSERPGVCKCENYIYNGEYGSILLYIKETIDKDVNNNTLVYSNNHILLGFKGEILF